MIYKYKKVILTVLVILIVVSISSNVSRSAVLPQQKNVLIIHSYNDGTKWTNDINTSTLNVLKKDNKNINISVEYMDWKNYPSGVNLQYLYDYLKYKYEYKHIDAIIASDDAAASFALKNRSVMFSDAPVVLCGINQDSFYKFETEYSNFTGVLEEIDPTDTINTAVSINPSIKNIYVIHDNSESGVSNGKLVEKKIHSMGKNLKVVPLNNIPFEKIIQTVSRLDNNSIVLMNSYYKDVTGALVEFEMASRQISKYSSVPVYHIYDIGLYNGGIGGNLLSGTLQGEMAADMAIRILNGEDVNKIPYIAPKKTRNVFDYKQLKRFQIPLSKIPKDSEIINKPFSFIQTYRVLVIGVLCAFFMLFIFVFMLLIHIKKIRAMRSILINKNEELTQIYEELVASDDEVKHQLSEVNKIQHNLSISEEKYTYLALHDALTGLPNRLSLFEEAKLHFTLLKNQKIALLFIDMDNFKYINDTLGHDFGDELIQKASERLQAQLDENGRLYRLGGDEFIITIRNIQDRESAEKITADIITSFKKEFEIQSSVLHISFSIGIAIYPEHGSRVEDLIKCADMAMYRVKEEGRNGYVVYNPEMNKLFMERMSIEKHLHTAMQSDEFEVYYQPQLDIKSNNITGLEALIRWKNPELGFVSPVKFIKVAEDTHLIIPLGEWVLRQACQFISNLHKKGYARISVSVNISILQLLQSNFNEMVFSIIEFYEIDPSCLELEITESILIQSFDAISDKLYALSQRGISIALDDFGKGYSSLSYLKQLPISTLKIDKCFIDKLPLFDEDKTITQHIISMGRAIGMSVVAEGVEIQNQLDYLTKYKCDKIQGYLFSKPRTTADIEELLEKQNSVNQEDVLLF